MRVPGEALWREGGETSGEGRGEGVEGLGGARVVRKQRKGARAPSRRGVGWVMTIGAV